MNELEIKFTRRWNDYLEQHKESVRRMNGETIQFVFHTFTGKMTYDDRAQDR